MIYLDNSSTTYKKPKCVIKAIKLALTKNLNPDFTEVGRYEKYTDSSDGTVSISPSSFNFMANDRSKYNESLILFGVFSSSNILFLTSAGITASHSSMLCVSQRVSILLSLDNSIISSVHFFLSTMQSLLLMNVMTAFLHWRNRRNWLSLNSVDIVSGIESASFNLIYVITL